MKVVCVTQSHILSNTDIIHDEALLKTIQLDLSFMQCFRLIISKIS
jgi:hypothetical protein